MLKLVPMPLRQYARFNGRMTRSQFFRWLGFLLIVYVICAWVDLRFIAPMLGYLPFEEVEDHYATNIAAALLFVPFLTSSVRRLHDVDKSGWWMLFGILPFLILFPPTRINSWLFSLFAQPATQELIPPAWMEILFGSFELVLIALALILFAPVIYQQLKKGSNEPNRFGARK